MGIERKGTHLAIVNLANVFIKGRESPFSLVHDGPGSQVKATSFLRISACIVNSVRVLNATRNIFGEENSYLKFHFMLR